ncbi:methyl-accepting chemotaxis protein [Rheinheimera baltica]|uniref:Methyl-accepting chemotaxis protein n=3 Tax=Rheinheimera baltica TaxID=67576 RepID=A0ABT9I1D5_9GAMM|nr:methyl-accepting chemotaxis protein [Rheinheimera baltica]MDP5137199.1 methyl-accepting chemotaxis protein [Rheinheimera baltica]MDP5142516.1 methyl-accepting chemotaxis protein [Rheinheimera baltica]MDP5150389.1 methyl-accepting chemotaxis protein [Rheinheimera baltica]
MKLTVALRVIGGFGIIALLLLIIGGTAYVSLNNISSSTAEVNKVSIPALENSAAMQSEFVVMSKLSLQAFNATSLSEIAAFRQRFNDEQQLYKQASERLMNAVQQEATLKSAAASVEKSYANFTPVTTQLFEQLENNLRLRDAIDKKMEELETQADDMASLVLDFTDIRDVKRRFPDSLQAAASIETGINTLVSNVVDLNRTLSRSTATTISNEIAFRLKDLNDQFALMQTETSGQVNLVSDLEEKIAEINGLLGGNNSIPALKQKRLQSTDDATNLLASAEEQTASAMKSLAGLLNQASHAAEVIQNDSTSQVSNAITLIFVVVLASILLAIFIATVTVRSISIPLAKVNQILGVVASGDMTQKLDDSAQDEFGDLARNCNKVIANLQQLIQGIISRSTQLAAASEQTSAITVQTTQAIREQKSQVTQAATATTEMSSTAQGVLQSANDAVAEIKNADNEAERVKGISVENKNIILQLSHEVEQASVVINKLHKDSASIGSILDVIRGIAEQTNLLALNAAIEAARAGEQGRGFAVVADEVRSLASKTQASTQEIQAMIQVLQSGAHAAVEAMNKGKKQAENCVEKTEVATKALDSITHAVHLAHDMSEQISDAAKEQNQVSHEISKLLESIVSIAEETASGAEQTSESSHEVARLAEELRVSVEQFKV